MLSGTARKKGALNLPRKGHDVGTESMILEYFQGQKKGRALTRLE